MSAEFQKYRFGDFLRATLLAPLASIPALLIVDLLIFIILGGARTTPQKASAMFGGWAALLVAFSLPSAYIATAIFGALGIRIANSRSVRLTTLIGAVAGVTCGAFTGLLWTAFRNLHVVSVIILPDAILCGLFVGVAYSILLNRSTQE